MPIIAPKPAPPPPAATPRPCAVRTSIFDNAHPESQRSRGLASDVPSPRIPTQVEAALWDMSRVLAVAECREGVFDARRRREDAQRNEDDGDEAGAENRPRDRVTINFQHDRRERRRRPRSTPTVRRLGGFTTVPLPMTMLDALLILP